MTTQAVLFPTPEMDCHQFFQKAWDWCLTHGFKDEIELVESRRFEDQTTESFFQEYVWVVVNSGMKNKIAEKIYRDFMQARDLNKIGHLGKREAIKLMMEDTGGFFQIIRQADNKLYEIDGLPWIGPITKYHLARNLGIDCAKPDRHLKRLADWFGFYNVQQMCGNLARRTGLRIGTVDVILWRYLAENGGIR